ncbi:MAG: polysaccharide deacetylase family protein [Gemmatimonadaceae bacterium]
MPTMVRSFVRSFALLSFGTLALAACGERGSSTAGAAESTRPASSASAASSPSAARAGGASAGGDVTAPAAKGSLPGNRLGRIPVLEYHVIGGTRNSLYTRTVESFRKDLDDVYRRGYRPINMTQLLDKNFSEVPAGMSPVVLVFDDASPEQFSYIERNGKLEVDPNSAIGIILDFQKTHPDWKSRGVFCLLNGAGAGHNFFGDDPKWNGQKKEWRFQKVKWLADQGYELCSHTLWHARLDKFSDAVVQEQFARNLMGIDSAVSGYKVRSMALPYGIWPKNRALAWSGSWKDPKTGQVHSYEFDAVMEVAGGPALSPYDPKFNGHSINRIQAVGDDIRKTLDRLDSTKTRFVWDGGR